MITTSSGIATKRSSRRWVRAHLAGAALASIAPGAARAQLLNQYLPNTVPGYAADPVMAVIAAGGPDYSGEGFRLGDVVVRPQWEESFGYDQNPLGLVPQRGSSLVESAATVRANTDWARDALGLSANIDDRRYLDLPNATVTTASAFAGGSLDVGTRDRFDVSGGYTSSALSPTSVLTQGITAPVPFQIADIRAAYTAGLYRLTLTPSIDFSSYRFGTQYGGGTAQDFRGLDKNQVTGGLTAAWDFRTGVEAVFTWQEVAAAFQSHPAGSPDPDYLDTLVVAGVRDDAGALFHWALLAGYDSRSFSAGRHSVGEPAIEAALTYYPSRLTTIEASFVRRVSDATLNIAQDTVYTEGALRLDHALRRNLIATARLDITHTDATFGQPARTQTTGQLGILWLTSRYLHVSANYFVNSGTANAMFLNELGLSQSTLPHATMPSYVSSAFSVTLHVQL